MREKIRSYFANLPAYREIPFELKDDDSVIELGLIDSFGILDLIAFLEDALHVEIEPEDMKRENFESIAAIEHFIAVKGNGPGGISP